MNMNIMKIASVLAVSLFSLGCDPEKPDYKPRTGESIKRDGNPDLKIDVDVPGEKGDVHVDVKKEP